MPSIANLNTTLKISCVLAASSLSGPGALCTHEPLKNYRKARAKDKINGGRRRRGNTRENNNGTDEINTNMYYSQKYLDEKKEKKEKFQKED